MTRGGATTRAVAAWIAFALAATGPTGGGGAAADPGSAPRLVRAPLADGSTDVDPPLARELPDYDGRPAPKPTPGERALWVPRVLLAPVYAVNEYVLRRPIGALALWGEENRVGTKIAHVLTFGTGGRVGLFPTAFFEFGMRPSVGFYLFARQVPDDGDRFGLHFAYGGEDWWRVSVRERLTLAGSDDAGGDGVRLGLQLLFDQRPDHLVAGTGVREDDRVAAFLWTRLGGQTDVKWTFGDLDVLTLSVDASRNRFGDGDGGVDKADASLFALLGDVEDPRAVAEATLPGFDGYELVAAAAALDLDSRSAALSDSGSGVRTRLFGGLGADVGTPDRRWAEWGLELGVYGDVSGRRRVIGLTGRVEVNEPLADGETPFTELPTLGGTSGLRGFVEGRIRGASTALATLQYTYPIAAFADGFVFYEVGNAYDGRFEEFSLGSLASSFGMGMQTHLSRDVAFSLLVGAGTVPFDAADYGIDSARVLIGAQRGF